MFSRPLPQKRRRRTTPAELAILEDAFRLDPLPDANSRAAIASRIGDNMNPRNVQIWFQNRRQKEKKDRDDGVGSTSADTSIASVDSALSREYVDSQSSYYHRTVPVSKCYLPPLSVNASTVELTTATDGRASVITTPLYNSNNNNNSNTGNSTSEHVWKRMHSDPPSESAHGDNRTHQHRASSKHRSISSTRAMPFVDPVSGTARLHSPLFDNRTTSNSNTNTNNNSLLPPKSFSQPLPRTTSSSSLMSDKSDENKLPRRRHSLYKSASLDVIASRPRTNPSSQVNNSSSSFSAANEPDHDTSTTSEEDDNNAPADIAAEYDEDSDGGICPNNSVNKRPRASSASSASSSSSVRLGRYYHSSEDGYSSADNTNTSTNKSTSKRARLMPSASLEKYYKVYFGPQKYNSPHHRHNYNYHHTQHRATNPTVQSSRIPNPPPLSLPSISQATSTTKHSSSSTALQPKQQEKEKLPSLTRKTLFPIQQQQQQFNYLRPSHNHHHNIPQQPPHHYHTHQTPRKYQQPYKPRHLSTPRTTSSPLTVSKLGNTVANSSSPSITTTPDRRRHQVRHAISDERDTECARVLLDLGSS